MTDYFFTIIDLGTKSFVNGSSFTQMEENDLLIKYVRPMYIDYDEYPPYSDRIFEIFVKNVNEKFSVFMVIHILQENRKYAQGLMRKVE